MDNNVLKGTVTLINRAQRPIILEVEAAHQKITDFCSEYSIWAGKKISWDQLRRKGVVCDCGSGKWGVEYRIYFVKDEPVKNQLVRYGFNVDSGDTRHDGFYRINSKDLFKELVHNNGFRLGENI